jgi:hypothetical protein
MSEAGERIPVEGIFLLSVGRATSAPCAQEESGCKNEVVDQALHASSEHQDSAPDNKCCWGLLTSFNTKLHSGRVWGTVTPAH